MIRWIRVSVVAIVVLLSVTIHSKPGAQAAESANREKPLPLCELLRSADRYNGVQVTVSATYRVGWEAQELYCLSCWEEKKRAWVEFDSQEGGQKAGRAVDRLVHGRGTVNGVFTGIFHTAGPYGHLGSYQNEFSVSAVRSLKLVDRLGFPPSALRPKSRARVCQ